MLPITIVSLLISTRYHTFRRFSGIIIEAYNQVELCGIEAPYYLLRVIRMRERQYDNKQTYPQLTEVEYYE